MIDRSKSPGRKWRWGWAFAFIFMFHAGLVFWFGERAVPSAAPSKPPPLIFMPADDASLARWLDLAGGTDPTLFALPHARGFSGPAWLNFRTARVEIATWSNAPSALPLPVQELGADLVRFAAASRVTNENLLAALRNTAPFEFASPPQAACTASTFIVQAPLNARMLPWNGTVPPATNMDVLTPTVVDLAVNGDGVVESVMLVAQSGLKNVDDRAIEMARSFAFQPLNAGRGARENAPAQRGKAIFTWHVVPPVLTNGLTASGL